MDIELLKTFLEVNNTRHFGKAADNLYITQAAVSARIKQIEDHLGVQLFIRQRNNIQLTAEGDRLLPHAQTMLMAWASAQQDVLCKTDEANHLAIGANPALWHYFFAQLTQRLFVEQPGLTLQACVADNDKLITALLDHKLDVALVHDAPRLPELSMEPLTKLKLGLVTSIDGCSLKDAMQDNYIFVDWGLAFNRFHSKRFLEGAGVILHTNMGSMAESFLMGNKASAYLPIETINIVRDKRLSIVDKAPVYSRDIHIVYRRNSEQNLLIEQLASILSNISRESSNVD